MTRLPDITKAARSEVRFWALFAVVMALFTQMLFPPQVMAMLGDHGPQVVLCSAGIDSQPILDASAAKIFKSTPHKPNGLAGLKCANCVLASVTAVTTPEPVFQPVAYTVVHADFKPAAGARLIKARAPPRPHSCGPPSFA